MLNFTQNLPRIEKTRYSKLDDLERDEKERYTKFKTYILKCFIFNKRKRESW